MRCLGEEKFAGRQSVEVLLDNIVLAELVDTSRGRDEIQRKVML
jgi:hypothetical protein